MQTRSSVLGKRQAMAEPSSPSPSDDVETKLPMTPESTPSTKRFKSSFTIEDGDNNKENIPPLRLDPFRTPTSGRRGRSLRRTTSELMTPTSARSTPRRTSASVSRHFSTPSFSVSPISLATPPNTPPAALQPISARARALLRPTANGLTPLAGRVAERDQIVSFINAFIEAPGNNTIREDEQSILYISGTPGTGKTAMVTSILRETRKTVEDAKVVSVVVNCMALNNLDALWDRLVDELKDNGVKPKGSPRKKARETSFETLNNLLDGKNTRCIVLLDELDHVATSSTALSSLFTLVHAHREHVRLIGIANTHTLSSGSSTALAGVQTLHFKPYTATQLLGILQARLAPLGEHENPGKDDAETKDKFLPLPTLTILSKKIAAQTGDVRAVMEVLRGAIDIAVNTTSVSSGNPLAEPTPAVTPSHVLSALKAYAPTRPVAPAIAPSPAISNAGPSVTVSRKVTDSETVSKVRALGLQARLALLAALLARKRLDAGMQLSGSPATTPCSTPRKSKAASSGSSGMAGLDLNHLHTYYKTVLARAENGNGVFTPVSRSEFGDLVNMLETVGLVVLSSAASGFAHGSPSKQSRRTASFGNMGRAGTQELRFVEAIRLDEVARGLGLDDIGAADVQEEEVRAIWERECARVAREVKASGITAQKAADAFDDANED